MTSADGAPSSAPSPNRPTGGARIRWWPIVLALVLTIAAMAGALVYFSALFGGAPSSVPPGNTPTGPCCLALGAAIPGASGSSWTYVVPMIPGPGERVGNLSALRVTSSSGENLSLPAASVELLGPSGCLVGDYAFSAGAWSNGPASGANACAPAGTTQSALTTGMTLVLWTGLTDLKGQGDVFVVTVSGGHGGEVACALP